MRKMKNVIIGCLMTGIVFASAYWAGSEVGVYFWQLRDVGQAIRDEFFKRFFVNFVISNVLLLLPVILAFSAKADTGKTSEQ